MDSSSPLYTSQLKHWVFDLDGTLINSCGLYDESIAQILRHYDQPVTTAILAESQNYFVPDDFFRLYLPESEIAPAVAMLMRLSHEQVERITAFPGMLELVGDLHARGVQLSIWTGRELDTSVRVLENLGFNKYINLLVTRSCVVHTKPAPEGLLKILKTSKHQGDDVVMIGDHAYDMAGARACGVCAISVSWEDKAPRPHPLATLSDQHFYNVKDFSEWALRSGAPPV